MSSGSDIEFTINLPCKLQDIFFRLTHRFPRPFDLLSNKHVIYKYKNYSSKHFDKDIFNAIAL